ncbi:MAG: hypothetical protein ABI813_11200 [Bacteroidota bacterium]
MKKPVKMRCLPGCLAGTLFQDFAEKMLRAGQWRNKYIFGLSKEGMYKQFNAALPEFAQRMPVAYIVSERKRQGRVMPFSFECLFTSCPFVRG